MRAQFLLHIYTINNYIYTVLVYIFVLMFLINVRCGEGGALSTVAAPLTTHIIRGGGLGLRLTPALARVRGMMPDSTPPVLRLAWMGRSCGPSMALARATVLAVALGGAGDDG